VTAHLHVVLDDLSLGPTTPVGTLTQERVRSTEVIGFAYDDQYLALPWCVQLDPELPLVGGRIHATPTRGMFGCFRDTAPDRWGRVLMERREAVEARHEGRRVRRLSEWDFLVGVSDVARLGALRLREASPPQRYVDGREPTVPPMARLRELEAIARELSRTDAEDRPEYERWLAQLVVPGTSLGGARPKASYRAEDGSLWLAKFPAHDDRRDVGAWEQLASEIARASGVDMAESRLLAFGGPYRTYAARRFDRAGGSRRLYVSAMTLLARSDGDRGSYLDIAEAIQTLGAPASIESDLAQLYRRVAVSILLANRDDHLRNHGFLRDRDGWRLAPAFDVNPNPDKHEHALAIDEADPSPSLATLHSTHAYYRLTSADAARIHAEVRVGVRSWRDIARTIGVSSREQRQLAELIDPDRE